MPRPIAGDPPAARPPAPFRTPPNGLPGPAPASPFNSTRPTLPAPAMPTAPTPAGLLNAFRRRWVLGTSVGVVVAAAVAASIWLALPGGKHQARVLVQLRPTGAEFANKNQENFAEYRDRQVLLLKSRELITRTLAEPAVAGLDTLKRSGDPVATVEDRLKVAVAADDVLEVSLTGDSLDDTKVILDHLVKRYVESANLSEQAEHNARYQKLEEQRDRLDLEIKRREGEIELLGKANGTTGGDDNATRRALLQRRHIESDAEYNRANREIGWMESELTVLRRQLADKEPKVSSQALVEQEIARNPAVLKARAAWEHEKGPLERDIARATNPEKDPFIAAGRAKVARLLTEYEEAKRLATAEAVVRVREVERGAELTRVNDLLRQIEVKKEEREKLEAERDALAKLIAAGVGGGLNIQAIRDALKPRREQLERLNAQLAQLHTTRQPDGRVSRRGEPEKIPDNNQNKKIAMSSAGGLASFLGVVLLVAFLEWRPRRVDGADRVAAELGLRVLGTVPAFPDRASLGAGWRFALNESINSARTMLLHAARTQSMRVVMVTSAAQGEGKTSLASQFAASVAAAGMRALLVDCDLRNPSVQKLFELPLGPGVSEALRQEVDAADTVQATAVPNLWVVTAGQCSDATLAALARGHPTETLFDRLRGQFDFVVVDSCPVLPVADTLLIGQHVDGVVFAIMQDVSQLPQVMTATEKLHQLNIPVLGAVVNGIKQDVDSDGYHCVTPSNA